VSTSGLIQPDSENRLLGYDFGVPEKILFPPVERHVIAIRSMQRRMIYLAFGACLVAGCANRSGVGEYAVDPATAARINNAYVDVAPQPSPAPNPQAYALSTALPVLFIFGGESHKQFLGALNTSKVSPDSIWNEFGEFGNKFSSTSIWNQFGEYGGRFSNFSPFNPYASDPPVLVDSTGGFYGYFTANQFHEQRTTVGQALMIVEIGSH